MKWHLVLIICFVFSGIVLGQPITNVITALDVFEVRRILNPPKGVAVVIYSSPKVQDQTREAGLLLHQFVGKPDFQFMVLVDLRKTMANWAPGYTKRRIQRNLMEKFKALPPVPGRDLKTMGRLDVSAIADFEGHTCMALGWKEPEDKLRVLVFSDGYEIKRWDNLTQMQLLPEVVRKALFE